MWFHREQNQAKPHICGSTGTVQESQFWVMQEDSELPVFSIRGGLDTIWICVFFKNLPMFPPSHLSS